MVEPTMFAVGFACGVLAAVIALVLLLGTLKGNAGGRRNPLPPANYKRPAPPPPPHPPLPGQGYQHVIRDDEIRYNSNLEVPRRQHNPSPGKS